MFEICSDPSKTVLKLYFFCQHSKMAKPFYFWQTVSKRPNLADLAFKKAIGNPVWKYHVPSKISQPSKFLF